MYKTSCLTAATKVVDRRGKKGETPLYGWRPTLLLPPDGGGRNKVAESSVEALRSSVSELSRADCRASGVSHSFGIAFSMNGIQELTYARRLTQLGNSFPHRICTRSKLWINVTAPNLMISRLRMDWGREDAKSGFSALPPRGSNCIMMCICLSVCVCRLCVMTMSIQV